MKRVLRSAGGEEGIRPKVEAGRMLLERSFFRLRKLTLKRSERRDSLLKAVRGGGLKYG